MYRFNSDYEAPMGYPDFTYDYKLSHKNSKLESAT